MITAQPASPELIFVSVEHVHEFFSGFLMKTCLKSSLWDYVKVSAPVLYFGILTVQIWTYGLFFSFYEIFISRNILHKVDVRFFLEEQPLD